jgi:hypothetical protein
MTLWRAVIFALLILGFQCSEGLIEKLVQFFIVLRGVCLEFPTKIEWDLEVEGHWSSRRNFSSFLRQLPDALFFSAYLWLGHKSSASFPVI